MGHRFVAPLGRLTSAALLAGGLLAMPAYAESSKDAGNPFDPLKGAWKGGGTVSPINGNPQKVDCDVNYTVTGNSAVQKLKCTGTDYKIDSSTKFNYNNGKITGSWNETTYDANGGVTGNARPDLVHARISGDKFSGRMSIAISDAPTINIVQLDEGSGIYRPVASLSLHR